MHPVVIHLKTLSTTNPLLEKSLSYGSDLVRHNLIGPYLFDGNVNDGKAYLEMLNNFALPRQVENIFGVNLNGSIPRAHGFQNGAPGHRLDTVHDPLQTLFPDRVVGILYLAFQIKCF